jgi:hypothetical protein
MTNKTLEKKYHKLSRLIDRLYKMVAFLPPSDVSGLPKDRRNRAIETEKFEKESICFMLENLKKEFADFTVWSRRDDSTPYSRFDIVFTLIAKVGTKYGLVPEKHYFESISFWNSMKMLPKYVGEEETNKLFTLVNEILIDLLKPTRIKTKE